MDKLFIEQTCTDIFLPGNRILIHTFDQDNKHKPEQVSKLHTS